MAQDDLGIVIRSEEDAWQLLQKLESGTVALDDKTQLEFIGWPNFQIYIADPKVKAAITPSMMAAFIDLQKTIYRSVAFYKYGTSNIRTLTEEDKSEYELQVLVKEGSSDQTVELANIATRLAMELCSKMSPEQVMITVITLGLVAASGLVFRAYISDRKDTRIAQIDSDEKKAQLEATVQLSQQETQRMQVFANAMSGLSGRDVVEKAGLELHDTMLKAASGSPDARMVGQLVPAQVATEIRKSPRRQAVIYYIDKRVKVIDVNTSNPIKFSVILLDEGIGDEYRLEVGDAMIGERDRGAIFAALKSRDFVWARMKVKDIEGEITPIELRRISAETGEESPDFPEEIE